MARLLITGGTGSFGKTAVKRFLDDKMFSEIIIFSRDESKQHDMRYEFNHPKLTFIVGDIRDKESVLKATKGVDYIFHAAALKQVPTGEYHPMEMIRTNILGTENVLSSAEENGVRKVVLLSTDKAVYPINAMGMSKAIAEKLVFGKARDSKGTVFCAVRYGNVMASRGSVIPLFVEYIKRNKPLTVTDPNMTRFLLSLEDAIDLVLLAIQKGEQGDLFIKKAPASTIADLTQALINIFKSKSKINVVGVRAGEKVHEALATQMEINRSEDLGGYYRIKSETSLDYGDFFFKGNKIQIEGDYTSENTKRLTVKEVEKTLLSLDYIKKELSQIKKSIKK
ncbi:MAG TPA: polysaccharide biosynthesis protein [Parcubacteria group bacterium]|jgi:UDP-glucose 4-epimerase|nr:polysaccharide biosynthesis protein [Parcubacteria group bacterium]